MANDNAKKIAAGFLLSKINSAYVDAYVALAGLDKFPISDLKTLHERLPLPEDDEYSPNRLIQMLFKAQDMPILSTQGALEKFHSALLPLVSLAGQPTPINPGDTLSGPTDTSKPSSTITQQDVCNDRAQKAIDKLPPNTPWKTKVLIFLTVWAKCMKESFGSLTPPSRPSDFVTQ
jgi:hypothetical protein